MVHQVRQDLPIKAEEAPDSRNFLEGFHSLSGNVDFMNLSAQGLQRPFIPSRRKSHVHAIACP